MDLRGLGYYLQTANVREQEQRQAQQQMQAFIQKAMIEGQIKQQTQALDPTQILSQLELMNIVNQMKGQGAFEAPQGQPQAQPQGQPMGQIPPGISPVAIPPAGVPTGMPAGMPRPPVAGVPTTQPMAQPQIGQQPLQRQYERVYKGTGKYGQPEYETKETLASELRTNFQKKITVEAAKLTGKQSEDFLKATRNLSRVSAASQGLVARGKQTVEEMGGFGFKQLVGAKWGQVKAASGFVPGIPLEQQFSGLAGFEGQLVEMTLALSPILTNQNRIIRGIVAMLSKTLPKFPTSEAQFTGKLNQTVKNAFRISIGLSKGLLTQEQIQNLNTGSEQNIQNVLNSILQNTTLSSKENILFQKMWGDIKATPASKPESLFGPREANFRQGAQSQMRQRQPDKKTFKNLWE